MLKKRAQTFNPKLENHKELHLTHMLAHPESMQLPLSKCMQITSQNRAAATTHLLSVRPVNTTSQTGAQNMNSASTLTGQTGAQQSP
jgi:Ulp1 family protease